MSNEPKVEPIISVDKATELADKIQELLPGYSYLDIGSALGMVMFRCGYQAAMMERIAVIEEKVLNSDELDEMANGEPEDPQAAFDDIGQGTKKYSIN